MKKKRATNFFESEEYKKLKGDTINLAVLNATTGVGYNSMRKKLNDLMEKTGANQSVGNKSETILLGRKIVAHQIAIAVLPKMTVQQSRHLFDELDKIAKDDMPDYSNRKGIKL